MSEFINQKELAEHFGLSKGYISKLVKQGILDGCRKDGKFVRACAILAIERYRANGSRRGRRSTQASVPAAVKNSPVMTGENMAELDALLAATPEPNRRVQIMRDYWSAKLNEYKAKEQEGELIRIDEAVEAGQKMIKAMRDKLLAIPSKLAPAVITMSESEALEALQAEIHDALSEVARLGER